jgi:holo-[acyl-carrier protein] synthase
MDPLPEAMALARAVGASRVELYTEPYAAAHGQAGQGAQLARFAAAAAAAQAQGLGVNAGHDLNRDNLADFLRAVPGVLEVSIGHALVADALELGLPETVRAYQRCIRLGPGGRGCPREPHIVIFGIGTDLCDIRRIAATLERRGERFAERVLGPAELQVFHARSARAPARGVRFLATRFSAKEAFSKAIGLGIRSPMTWRDCEILNQPSGKPVVRLSGELAGWFAARPGRARHRHRRSGLRLVLRGRRNPAPITAGKPAMTPHAPVMLDVAGTTLSKAERQRLRTRSRAG